MNPERAYDWLRDNSVETAYMVSAAQVLAWDQRTYMPGGGHAHRAEQMAIMAKLLHGRTTDSLIGERLADVEGSDMVADPLSAAAVNVREWRRDYDRSARIPQKLAMDLARETAQGESVWEAARPRNDWDAFVPHLARIVNLLKEKASALGYENEPYDALLDEYEPWMTTKAVEEVFDPLVARLVPVVQAIGDAPKIDDAFLQLDYSPAKHEVFGREVLEAIGFPLDSGRLDVSPHPFTTSLGDRDVRLTTRYNPKHMQSSMFGTIHEAGHGLYELGFSDAIADTILANGASLGMHESQSRTWENLIGRSRSIWRRFFPRLQELLPEQLGSVTDEDFYRAINTVEPSLIRVEADEVTYSLRIILRFELEKRLITGDLRVADLPVAWRDEMKRLLGMEPPDDSLGVLQDIHRSMGDFGYFPTYALGNLYGAQFDRAMRDDIADTDELIANGEFGTILPWQRTHIHGKGSIRTAAELCRDVSGDTLDPDHFLDYIRGKYNELYHLS